MATTLTERVQSQFPGHVLAAHHYRGQDTVVLAREALAPAMRFLRDDPEAALDILMDVSCVDYLKFGRGLSSAPLLATPSPLPYYMPPVATPETWQRGVSNDAFRFEMVYHLFSSTRHHRLRVKVPLAAGDPTVDSLTGLWEAANWFEREVWDMFGIRFTGHPNLKRILMYEGFTGHALRKDYPVNRRQPLIGPVN